MVQWLGLHTSSARGTNSSIQSLFLELRSYKLGRKERRRKDRAILDKIITLNDKEKDLI